MKIDGYTRLAAVVANPIKHSISPFIHNAAFEQAGVNGVYVAWEISEDDLKTTVENIRRYNMFGINLSMPYKQAVIPFLDELTPAAQMIGAVNTVVNQNGKLIGYNTDGKGFFMSLPSFVIKGKKMLILGAGGAATAIIVQAVLEGADEIFVFTRKTSFECVLQQMKQIQQAASTKISVLPLEQRELLQEKLNTSALLVNGTSLGMDEKTSPVPDTIRLSKNLLVADVIYQPFETPFLKWAKKQNVQVVNGLGMLLYQAAEAFKLWTGKDMPTKEIWQALEQKYN